MTKLRELYETLDARQRPEDVAQMVQEILGKKLQPKEKSILERASKRSLKRGMHSYTSMLQTFIRPKGMDRQIKVASDIFQNADRRILRIQNPANIEKFIKRLCAEIRKTFGKSDFKADRLNSGQRKKAKLDISRRRYNKLFRHVARMEEKLAKYARELKKYEFTRISKSSLAHKIPWTLFSKNVDSACFIAYLTARSNLRSVFTNTSQQRAYDEIADMLFKRCKGKRGANWLAMAYVYPNPEVLSHLKERERGKLLGQWYGILQDISLLLKEVWESSDINKKTMIVKRGNDSSTWNSTAGAWNKARTAWINLTYSLQLEKTLDVVCPGKVLRLMAADVASWHRRTGGDLDPNTTIWSSLPLPWEVLHGRQKCGRSTIEGVCKKFKFDPIQTGWIAPRPKGYVEKYRPTQELVHGVAVSNPHLAKMIRKAGWFSGKGSSPIEDKAAIHRDENGFALKVTK